LCAKWQAKIRRRLSPTPQTFGQAIARLQAPPAGPDSHPVQLCNCMATLVGC